MWDFVEIIPAGDVVSNFSASVEWVAEVVEKQGMSCNLAGQIEVADATESPLPSETVGVWFTDPPYYDAIPYSDLSDFFLVWMKRTLAGHQCSVIHSIRPTHFPPNCEKPCKMKSKRLTASRRIDIL